MNQGEVGMRTLAPALARSASAGVNTDKHGSKISLRVLRIRLRPETLGNAALWWLAYRLMYQRQEKEPPSALLA
jgi:hypothetical protein